MALYAFDGTWNIDEVDEAKESNVLRFCKALSRDYNVFYQEGVGTKAGFIGKVLGGVTGLGGRPRVKDAYDRMTQYFAEGDDVIDIIGFSRGAALAVHFANEVWEKRRNGAPIRFVGLWDVVASFGLPGNDLNVAWTLTLPPNVRQCYHAMALDERRHNFPLTRIQAPRDGPSTDGRLQEVWFRGVHSDVGGGLCLGLGSIALCWMLRRAKAEGLPVVEERLERYVACCDATAAISKNFDPIVNAHRTILLGDSVHESVTPRGRVSDLQHLDPPAGLTVVYG
jgi:uncharacterized protein (DUF2235 family)